MTTFDRALAHLFIMEGGYVNDPHDPGGETNFGISKRYHPHEDIKRMTRERAGEIYREEYWEPLSCEDMPYFIALAVFDSGVNQGVIAAAKLLQQELRVIDDGIIGPITLRTITEYCLGAHRLDLLHGFMARRAVRYAKNSFPPGYEDTLDNEARYLRGWMKRLFHVHGAALSV